MNLETCKYKKHCSGCQLQNMDYASQLAYKQKKLAYLFRDIKNPEPIIGMDTPYRYRNKCQFSFRQTSKKETRFGIYQSKTKSTTPVSGCLLDDPAADAIAHTVSKLAHSFKLTIYDYHQQKGFLRHVLIRTGYYSKQIMVVLVASSPVFQKKKQFVNALLHRHPEITTVVFSVTESEKMVLGKQQEVLYGPGIITDTMLGKKFIISPASFYQINTIQAERLYRSALDLAQLHQNDVLIDAYCGTGTIGLIASSRVKQVIGIESNTAAVNDAQKNARLNQVDNASFICADASDYMTALAKSHKAADVVILDPPRAGATQKCLRGLLKLQPKRIVYISCNPETQVRDLRTLLKEGYQVKLVQGFDLFPMTRHVETVALLQKP